MRRIVRRVLSGRITPFQAVLLLVFVVAVVAIVIQYSDSGPGKAQDTTPESTEKAAATMLPTEAAVLPTETTMVPKEATESPIMGLTELCYEVRKMQSRLQLLEGRQEMLRGEIAALRKETKPVK